MRAGLMLLIDYYTPADEKWTLSTFGWCPDMWKSHKITFHWSNLSTWFRMWAKATLVVGPIHWWLSSQHIPNLKSPNRKKPIIAYCHHLSSIIITSHNISKISPTERIAESPAQMALLLHLLWDWLPS
jgi:hypothetical protein